MIQFLYDRKRHSPGRQENPEWLSSLLIEKAILQVNRKSWKDSVSYLSTKESLFLLVKK